MTRLTLFYGPAVRRNRFLIDLSVCDLASMYPASDRRLLCAGPSDISPRAFFMTCQASNGPFGSPGFADAGKTGPPFRFILSHTSPEKREARASARS